MKRSLVLYGVSGLLALAGCGKMGDGDGQAWRLRLRDAHRRDRRARHPRRHGRGSRGRRPDQRAPRRGSRRLQADPRRHRGGQHRHGSGADPGEDDRQLSPDQHHRCRHCRLGPVFGAAQQEGVAPHGQPPREARVLVEPRRQTEGLRRQRVRHDPLGTHTRGVDALDNPIENYGSGTFTIDWDKSNTLPREVTDTGDDVGVATFQYSHVAPTAVTTINVDFNGVKDDKNGEIHNAIYRYTATPGAGGDFKYGAVKDAFPDPGNTGTAKETVSVHSRWLETGAGRSDYRVAGSDVRAILTVDAGASECWDRASARRSAPCPGPRTRTRPGAAKRAAPSHRGFLQPGAVTRIMPRPGVARAAPGNAHAGTPR